MKKSATGILLMVLHTMRGRELSLTIDGPLSQILYYGTVVAYIIGLIGMSTRLSKLLHQNWPKKIMSLFQS